MLTLLTRIFGSKHAKDIKRLRPLVQQINEIEEQYQALSDDALVAKTAEFKQRIADGATTDELLCEAFAAVKNACRRLMGQTIDVCGKDMVWDMIPFDVQLMGGIVLHQGKIAEMQTGEGKTLVATLPLYLNALTGRNVQLVTTNDYLARRDAHWMGAVYEYLGLSVGCIQNQMSPEQRRQEYAKDITYGTNSEFGFDYLRDNGLAYHKQHVVQRDHFYAIIDEVDSILIDEARTPLIISGPSPVSSHQYFELKPKVEALVRRQRNLCNELVREARQALDEGQEEQAQLLMYQLHHGMPKHKQFMHMLEDPSIRKLHEKIENLMLTDMRKEQARELRERLYFNIDERGHDANLTEMGCEALNPSDPDAYVLPDLVTCMAELDAAVELSEEERARRRQAAQEEFAEKSERIHNVDQLIRAYCVYERDVDYVVQDNQVLIVDEFTGRVLPGRRWSDGLHQAVEAKEGAKIERESQTLATVTIQNYFRMYDKLAGMTGTAETEAGEFHEIYKLDVVVIPTNRPVRRVDANDVVYKTQREKYRAIIDEIRDCHERAQPVLVGTASVDTSEVISRMLRRAKIAHTVLNAKQNESEADIVARAGQPGAVTIATNMAGRGTDIKLAQEVVYLDRELIVSQTRLEDRVDGGKTLRQLLQEKPCGLHVIGSERHESRRIDRQLRGRCARQGDPGSSRFFVSLEDDLMRLFGSERISGIMAKLGLEEGQELEHSLLNRSIESAQRRVEQQNFAIRKRTLEYDDVMNRQREIVYGFRGDLVAAEVVRDQIYDVLEDVIGEQADLLIGGDDTNGAEDYAAWLKTMFPIAIRTEELKACTDADAAVALVMERVRKAYELKVRMEHASSVGEMERQIALSAIDSHWQDYLRSMDNLRQGVGLRAYGQRDPLIEYKREAFDMFAELMRSIKQEIATNIFRSSSSVETFEEFLAALPKTMIHDEISILGGGGKLPAPHPVADAGPRVERPDLAGAAPARPRGGTVRRTDEKVGRNDPCPCGSGKKYKKCCGQ